ncbi:MAG TPA: hypothetical protein VM840_11755 [Actinomycetota bacterium]|nr:hypothetical protein [Actinomycetota bacterium]
MSWMLRHAVLPLAIAYAVFLSVLIAGERSLRSSGGRRRHERGSFVSSLVHLVSLAAGGYAVFVAIVGAYCVAQRDPIGCLAPAVREAGTLAAAAFVAIAAIEGAVVVGRRRLR